MIGALLFGVLALAMALALETSNLYVAKVQNQRAADLGNLAGAATPSPVVNNVASAIAIATAANVAGLNGMPVAGVMTVGTSAPDGSGIPALKTTVVRQKSTLFKGLIGGSTSNTVGATSIASLTSAENNVCVASLLGPANIYGSASAIGPSCSLSASTYLAVCGTAALSLATVNVGYSMKAEAPYLCSTSSIAPPASAFNYKTATTDTIATSAGIVGIKAHFAAMANPGWPYGTTSPKSLLNPVVSTGANKTYTNEVAVLTQGVKYGSLTVTDATLSFAGGGTSDPTCAAPTTISGNVILSGANSLAFASGCYVFAGSVVAQGGSTNTLVALPGTMVNFVFKQHITNGYGVMTLPDASYSFNGSIINTAGGNLNIGSGTKIFGAAINNGPGTLSILAGPHYVNGGTITNNGGNLSFGNGNFYLWGGSMGNYGSGNMSYGDGPFYFYGGTITNATGRLYFGNGPFYFNGGSLTLSAGSTTRFGIGDIDFYGGTISMAGASTTFGYGGSSTTGSSTVSLYGGSLSLTTQNLTAVGVTFAFHGGTISLLGIGTINATAPTASSPTYGYQNILFVVFGGAFNLYQSGNTVDTLSGIIYVPSSNASIYGRQTVNYPSGGCLQLIAGVVDIYQNARINFSPCSGLALKSGRTMPALLQ